MAGSAVLGYRSVNCLDVKPRRQIFMTRKAELCPLFHRQGGAGGAVRRVTRQTISILDRFVNHGTIRPDIMALRAKLGTLFQEQILPYTRVRSVARHTLPGLHRRVYRHRASPVRIVFVTVCAQRRELLHECALDLVTLCDVAHTAVGIGIGWVLDWIQQRLLGGCMRVVAIDAIGALDVDAAVLANYGWTDVVALGTHLVNLVDEQAGVAGMRRVTRITTAFLDGLMYGAQGVPAGHKRSVAGIAERSLR